MSRAGLIVALAGWTLAVASALPAPAAAWGRDGHWIVCELAYRQLSDDARAEVDRLVDLHPDEETFAEGCHWPDTPRKRPTEHYVNYDRSTVEVGPLTEPANDPNVVTAIVEDADRLGDRTLPDRERADALLYLGHWVGDVHQPLHVSFADDRGGNGVDKRGTCAARNLHAVWDTCIVQREAMGLTAGETKLARTVDRAREATADRLARALPDGERADRIGSAPPWRMAAESYRIVTHPAVGYCVRAALDAPCAYAPGNLTLDEGEAERTIEMDEAYTARMKPVVEESLLFASVRLAALIEGAVAASEFVRRGPE